MKNILLGHVFNRQRFGPIGATHTPGLQEQRGVYGSIQINPTEKTLDYDEDLMLVLSDWMDEKPQSQLKNLKRANEWYLIKKGQVQSLDKLIKKKAVGAKRKMASQEFSVMTTLKGTNE